MSPLAPDKPCEGEGKAGAETVLVALVLVAMMSLALCGTAFASSTSSTVSSPTDGDTGSVYSLWKLFDLVDLGSNTYVITPVATYKSAIISTVNSVTGSTLDASSSDHDIQTAISNYTTTHDSAQAQTLAKAFYDIVKNESADVTITAASGSTSGTGNVGPGYYVLAETTIGDYNGGDGVATRPILYAVGNNGFTVTTKESYPTDVSLRIRSQASSKTALP